MRINGDKINILRFENEIVVTIDKEDNLQNITEIMNLTI